MTFQPSPRLTAVRPDQTEERQRQRAVRLLEVIARAGRDEQRLERASGHAYLVFPDRASADEVMQEIAATPILSGGLEWPVQIWDEAARAGIGTFEAADGRIAVGHHWTSAERTWIADYVDGWRTVAILNALPADWKPKQDAEPGSR